MTKKRLDQAMLEQSLVPTRSQAGSFIRLGKVTVNGKPVTKPGQLVSGESVIKLNSDQYVSRAALKLASVAKQLGLEFRDKIVLDVGSSTGGFTDFALRGGAAKVIAVDVGSNQLHPSLRDNMCVELHEQTDIRVVGLKSSASSSFKLLIDTPDIIVIDVSFISLRDVLPHIASLCGPNTLIVAMVKPQFEVGDRSKNKGVVKNERDRRDILKDFEQWAKQYFAVQHTADSGIAGEKGNVERFYLLRRL